MSQAPNPYNPNAYNPYRSRSPVPLEYGSTPTTSEATRTFFNAVYAWMCAGLAVTATVAYFVASHPNILRQLGFGGILVLIVAELALVWTISSSIQRISAGTATVLFLLYAALNGVLLSAIFLVYSTAVISGAFVITAGMFGSMSLYGYFTKKDLSGWGSLLFMGLIGIILASIVSLFFHNSALNVLINYAAVLIFVGLTAYDTQMLKNVALQTQGNAALAARLSVSGALSLYLDFINLFLQIARILGDRR